MDGLDLDVVDGRRILVGELSRDWRWVQPDADRFVLFVAADASSASDEVLASYAAAAISAGCVYVCVWGQDCSRVHDCFDIADLELSDWSADDAVVMSSLHPEESLVEALYFALELAIPEDEPPDMRTAVVAAVQQPWLEETRSLLNDQELLRRLWSGDG
ncbi:MAG TPA: hypothetical protein VMI75_10560 [Polyangiaceae bacterium]|nr:hypothetical protein [Polyangiaceae bacterium]